MFWSGVDLTGNQTQYRDGWQVVQFWSGVDLTGNQTVRVRDLANGPFWSGVDLTGNQTGFKLLDLRGSFGAVSI